MIFQDTTRLIKTAYNDLTYNINRYGITYNRIYLLLILLISYVSYNSKIVNKKLASWIAGDKVLSL